MRITVLFGLIALGVAASGYPAGRLIAQHSAPDQSTNVSKRASEDGAALYVTYCADCHGKDGKTKGPLASRRGLSVPDLQLLTRRNKGVFPGARVETLLSATEQSPILHGGIQMPVWGPVLSGGRDDQNIRQSRAHALARYLETIQK